MKQRTPKEDSMRAPRGAWRTRAYPVALSDGTTRSVYAENQAEAEERMRRHLARHGSDLVVAPMKVTVHVEELQ